MPACIPCSPGPICLRLPLRFPNPLHSISRIPVLGFCMGVQPMGDTAQRKYVSPFPLWTPFPAFSALDKTYAATVFICLFSLPSPGNQFWIPSVLNSHSGFIFLGGLCCLSWTTIFLKRQRCFCLTPAPNICTADLHAQAFQPPPTQICAFHSAFLVKF